MRLRLILSFIFIVLITIITVVLVARQRATNEVRAFMYRGESSDITGRAETLQEYYRTHGSWDGAESLLLPNGQGQGRGKGRAEGQSLILADAQGNTLVNTHNPEDQGVLSLLERQSAIPLVIDGDTVGYIYVQGGANITREQGQNLISRLNNAALVAALVAGAISMLLALFLAYRFMRPVNELTRAAERLGEGDFSQCVQVHGSDELAVLGRSFNQMVDHLEDAETRRRAMTADIAHELRNPLAIQRANLEALQDGIYPPTPENLEPVIEQNVLLTRLVEDLRTLAQADAGHLELDLVLVNLMDLAQRVVERYQSSAKEHDIALRIEKAPTSAAGGFEIMADPLRLEQVLGNLLDNALRYTPDGGQIDLQIIETGQNIQLTIHDSGPGIPGEALSNIFNRFYRVDRSRSRTDGGSGLGLAISRQLTEAHGGNLNAANHSQGGAVFTLSFSAASSANTPAPLTPPLGDNNFYNLT